MNISKFKQIGKLILLGLIVGVINGLVGGFAGIISIIALKKYFFMSQKNAQATTLSYIFILSLITSLIYMQDVNTDIIMCVWLIIGGIIGTFIGTRLLKKLKNNTLNMIFAIIMILTGVMVIIW